MVYPQFSEVDMFTFGVVATKGGVGKTTVAANLGGLLADIGYRVLLIDADVVGPAKFTATSNPAIHSGFCAPAWP